MCARTEFDHSTALALTPADLLFLGAERAGGGGGQRNNTFRLSAGKSCTAVCVRVKSTQSTDTTGFRFLIRESGGTKGGWGVEGCTAF